MKVWIVEMDRNWESNVVSVFSSRADAKTWCEAQGAVEQQGEEQWLVAIPCIDRPGKFDEHFFFIVSEWEVIEPNDTRLTIKHDPNKLQP